MQATHEMVSLSIYLHLFFIASLFLIALRLLFLLNSKLDYKPLTLKYENWVLFYRAILSGIFFTGIVVMAVSQFVVGWQVWLMVAVSLHMLATTIKEYIYYKQTHIKNQPSQETWKKIATKKYKIDLILLSIVTALSYLVSIFMI
jgi:hypothetical protein